MLLLDQVCKSALQTQLHDSAITLCAADASPAAAGVTWPTQQCMAQSPETIRSHHRVLRFVTDAALLAAALLRPPLVITLQAATLVLMLAFAAILAAATASSVDPISLKTRVGTEDMRKLLSAQQRQRCGRVGHDTHCPPGFQLNCCASEDHQSYMGCRMWSASMKCLADRPLSVCCR